MSGKNKDRGDGPTVIAIGSRPAPRADGPPATPSLVSPEALSEHAAALAACEAAPAAASVASLQALGAAGPRPALSLKRPETDVPPPAVRLKPRQT